MIKTFGKDSRGIAPLILILVGVVVVAGIGFAAWRILGKKDTPANKAADSSAEAKCGSDDADLCKFFANYKVHDTYKVNSEHTTTDGTKSATVFEGQGKDKSHIIFNVQGVDTEMIIIGKVTYTKASSGTWWKQTQPEDEPNEYTQDYEPDLEGPSKDEPEVPKTEYKKIGTEACGDLQCFKYQVIDPTSPDQEQFIWFDTKDYQIRRQLTSNDDGTDDMAYTYTAITINEPSPVKELGPDQMLVPGQAEPTTIPAVP